MQDPLAAAWDEIRARAKHRAAYDRRIVALEDGTWYWHLYLNGERLNGGLSPSREEARTAADHAITFELSGPEHAYSGWPGRLRTSVL